MAVDLGFAGIIEKFEEYWGKRATRWLLMVIGVAVVAACVGAIWTWLVTPILVFLDTPLWGQTLASIAFKALGVGAGVALGFGLSNDLVRWRRTRQLKTLVAQARGLMDETRVETSKMIKDSREALSLSETQLDQIAETAKESRSVMEIALLNARAAVEMNVSLSAEERAKTLSQLDKIQRDLEAVPSAKAERKSRGRPKRPVRRTPKADGAGGSA